MPRPVPHLTRRGLQGRELNSEGVNVRKPHIVDRPNHATAPPQRNCFTALHIKRSSDPPKGSLVAAQSKALPVVEDDEERVRAADKGFSRM